MSARKPEDCTVEHLINDLSFWENPDAVLLVSSTELGGIYVGEFDGDVHATAPTMKEALIKFGRAVYTKYEHYMVNPSHYGIDWLA